MCPWNSESKLKNAFFWFIHESLFWHNCHSLKRNARYWWREPSSALLKSRFGLWRAIVFDFQVNWCKLWKKSTLNSKMFCLMVIPVYNLSLLECHFQRGLKNTSAVFIILSSLCGGSVCHMFWCHAGMLHHCNRWVKNPKHFPREPRNKVQSRVLSTFNDAESFNRRSSLVCWYRAHQILVQSSFHQGLSLPSCLFSYITKVVGC